MENGCPAVGAEISAVNVVEEELEVVDVRVKVGMLVVLLRLAVLDPEELMLEVVVLGTAS